MKFSARLFIVFISLVLGFLFLSPRNVLALSPPSNQQPKSGPFDFSLEKFTDILLKAQEKENNNNPLGTANVSVSVERTIPYQQDVLMAGLLDNISPLSPQLSSSKIRAIPALAQIIGTMYANPPASGLAYTGDLLVNAGFIAKPAYAQGIGFAGLAPLLPLWKTARNISYSILIIVMVVVGFMIIFRAKIDPKTVISVQSALPRIVFTLILITFSYAIAGFMIDLMYLAMTIVIGFLGSGLSEIKNTLPPGTEFMTQPAMQQTEFITGGGWKLFISIFNGNMWIPFITQMLGGSVPNTVGIFGLSGALGAIMSVAVPGTILAGFPVWGVGVVLPSLIILLLIFLGLLFTFIRLAFLLLNSYIQILVGVIIGPLLLLKEAIPGQSAFKEWIQNLIANLVVFPATAGVIYASWIFTAVAWKGNLWNAPLMVLGGGGGNSNGNPLAIFMGLSIIFLAPNLVASVKKAFHPKPALPLTAGSAFAPVTGAAQTGMGAMSQFYYMKQILGSGEGAQKGTLGNIAKFFGYKSK